ncbi:integrase, catalytic region, zinc finger, CCHC-type containing protein, partial [Tanacetum coccineum]
TDNGTEFVNQVMSEYYECVGIFHQKSVPRTPQQNIVVERRNRTLVEAARTMMIFSKASMFLWAEAVATGCYTQDRSLIHTRYNKTPYELVHDKKPDLTFFRVFGTLCYPTNDSENLGKFQAKADIGIFIGADMGRVWKTMSYNEKTGVYSCQVDEQWFDLSDDLLRKALAITPVSPAHPFELPPSGDTVIDFVNELGYPEPCLTGKTSDSDKPRHPVLQMLWGIVTQTNVDNAELIWEEFTQGIQTFFSHKASHKSSLKNPKKKVTPLLIPYGRFSKVIIYYLASNNNIHRRPDSAVHHTGDDYILC